MLERQGECRARWGTPRTRGAVCKDGGCDRDRASSRSASDRPSVALQMDAGYIKAPRQQDGTRWIPVVASKLIWPKTPHTHAHAYAVGHEPTQGLRQQAFLQSVGIGPQVPITVLNDGGDDINFACKLPSATARVLDWYHISMRFENLLMSIRGLRGTDVYSKNRLRERVNQGEMAVMAR